MRFVFVYTVRQKLSGKGYYIFQKNTNFAGEIYHIIVYTKAGGISMDFFVCSKFLFDVVKTD